MNSDSGNPDFSTVRSAEESDKTWYSLLDICKVLGAPSDADYLQENFFGIPKEHRSIRTLYDTQGSAETLPVVDADGFAHFLMLNSHPSFSALHHSLLVSAVPQVLRSQVHASKALERRRTQWGEQPMRRVMRAIGSSVAQTAVLMSNVPELDPQVFKAAMLNAVLLGRQLPSPGFVLRAQYVLQRAPRDLFSEEVFAAYTKKYGDSSPSKPSPAPAPVPASSALPPVAVDEEVDPEFEHRSELRLSAKEKEVLGIVELPSSEPSWEPVGLSEAEEDAVYNQAFGAGLGFLAEQTPSSADD
jgi:hypothetical protein